MVMAEVNAALTKMFGSKSAPEDSQQTSASRWRRPGDGGLSPLEALDEESEEQSEVGISDRCRGYAY